MNVNKFVDFSKKFKVFNNNGFDDFVDRLNFKVTGLYLSVCFLAILLRQFLMKPITCYISSDTGGINLLEYMEYYCYVTGSVGYNFNDRFPNTQKQWRQLNSFRTNYYQWIIFIFGLQMLCFYMPQYIWKISYKGWFGRDFRPLIKSGSAAAKLEGPARDEHLKLLSMSLHKCFRYKICKAWGKSKTMQYIEFNKIFAVYIIIKCFYIINTIGQIVLLTYLLNGSPATNTITDKATDKNSRKEWHHIMFGIEIFINFSKGIYWPVSQVFPRTAFCNAQVVHLGTVNSVTAQCTLPLNMLVEKMFLLFWCWCCFLFISNIISIIIWIVSMLRKQQAATLYQMISYYHRLQQPENRDIVSDKLKSKVQKFLDDHLKSDGVFILRMIRVNCGEILTIELLGLLYKNWREAKASVTQQCCNNKVVKLEKPKERRCEKPNEYKLENV